MNYIIYHLAAKNVDCPDGIMSAAIAARYFWESGMDCKIIGDTYKNAKDYGEVPDIELPLTTGDRLYIVDFSYPAYWLQYWESLGAEVVVLDHHKDKFEMLRGFKGAILDENECGSTLTWKYFFPGQPMPVILKHVHRRDTGIDGYYRLGKRDQFVRSLRLFKLNGFKSIPQIRKEWAECSSALALKEGSRAINEGLALQRANCKKHFGSAINACQGWLQNTDLPFLRQEGDRILQENDKIIRAALPRIQVVDWKGSTYGFIQLHRNEDRHYSTIGNLGAKLRPELDYIHLKTSDGGNHLRSTGFDVSVVAKARGGGGHTCAAGWRD